MPAASPAGPDPEQLELIGPRGGLLPRRGRSRSPRELAAVNPVAEVVLDSPLRRLDRVFEYLVSADLAAEAVFGARVRVPFAGQRMHGYLVGRRGTAEHAGTLQYLTDVVSPVPVLTSQTLDLSQRVAQHYAGTLSDVLRLAVPPRHAGAEADPRPAPALPTAPADPGELPTAAGNWVWQCPASTDWTQHYARGLAVAAAAGRPALALVGDDRELRRLASALTQFVGPDGFAVLSAGQPPYDRYRDFGAVLAGRLRIVIGTRSAAFAPIGPGALLLIWDDGDDNHAERRAPYPHAREVLAMRTDPDSTFVVGGYARSPIAQRWVDIGWAQQVPQTLPRRRLLATGADEYSSPAQRAARIPPTAAAAIRAGLEAGPVLVCVARRGYLPRLACQNCRRTADCQQCGGALELSSGHATATCTRCGRLAGGWQCPDCGSPHLRSIAVGSERTAVELGRAFPGARVITSTAPRIVAEVGAQPALVIATPGAEPVPAQGYAAVVLLDLASAMSVPGLRTAEQMARRWFNAAALVAATGQIVAVADADEPIVQALLRWAPNWLAARELSHRVATGMPPAVKAIEVLGPAPELEAIRAELASAATILGPVPVPASDPPLERILVTAAHRAAPDILAQLRATAATRSAAGGPPVTIRVDPVDLL